MRYFRILIIFMAAAVLAAGCHDNSWMNATDESTEGEGETEVGVISASDVTYAASSVSGRGGLFIYFPGAMDHDDVAANLLVTDSEGGEIEPVLTWMDAPSASVSADVSVAEVLKVAGPLPYCDSYDILIPAGTLDAAGNELDEDVLIEGYETGYNPLDFDRGLYCTADYSLYAGATLPPDTLGNFIFKGGQLLSTTPIDLVTPGTGLLAEKPDDVWLLWEWTSSGYSNIAGIVVPDISGDGRADAVVSMVTDAFEVTGYIFDSYASSDTADAYLDYAPSVNAGKINPSYYFADVDGDGINDQMVGELDGSNEMAYYLVLGGSDSGSYDLLDLSIEFDSIDDYKDEKSCQLWGTVGDLDGDEAGLADIAICKNDKALDADGYNEVQISFGRAEPLFMAQNAKVVGYSYGEAVRFNAVAAGDLNGDGYKDLIVRETDDATLTAYVFFGPIADAAELDVANADVTIADAGSPEDATNIAVIGDFNADGFEDLIIGDRDNGGSSASGGTIGEAYIILGRADWGAGEMIAPLDYDVLITNAQTISYTGRMVSHVGDIDNDGYDDVMVEGYDDSFNGHVRCIFAGRSSADLADQPTWTCEDADSVLFKD